MAKGAKKTGGTSASKRQRDKERCKHLPPAPSVRRTGWTYPYHGNMGTNHKDKFTSKE